ncbi:MAG: hypothetical protein AB7S68_15670 [Polyangiaceae bacterium]
MGRRSNVLGRSVRREMLGRCGATALRSLCAATVLLSLGESALAADISVDQCLDASERGQRERDGGELKSARESFVTCSNQACPRVVQKDCVAWLNDVERRVPSLVLRVRDPDGNDIAEVQLRIDDAQEAQTLDGNALVMDPGKRVFHFERAGYVSQSQEIVVREGEQARLVDVVLVPLAAQHSADAGSRAVGPKDAGGGVPTLAWVLGGVGVVALGSYAYFGLQAKSERDDLDSCKPTCPEADVDSARSKWLLSNVSCGVGVVALGAAVWISLDRPSGVATSTTRAGFAPAPGGAVGMFSTAF